MAKYIFLLIFLLGAAALFFLVRRSRRRRKKALFLGSCALLFLLLALLGTLVGSLIRFNTAEGVFRYMAHGKVECVPRGARICRSVLSEREHRQRMLCPERRRKISASGLAGSGACQE